MAVQVMITVVVASSRTNAELHQTVTLLRQHVQKKFGHLQPPEIIQVPWIIREIGQVR